LAFAATGHVFDRNRGEFVRLVSSVRPKLDAHPPQKASRHRREWFRRCCLVRFRLDD